MYFYTYRSYLLFKASTNFRENLFENQITIMQIMSEPIIRNKLPTYCNSDY